MVEAPETRSAAEVLDRGPGDRPQVDAGMTAEAPVLDPGWRRPGAGEARPGASSRSPRPLRAGFAEEMAVAVAEEEGWRWGIEGRAAEGHNK